VAPFLVAMRDAHDVPDSRFLQVTIFDFNDQGSEWSRHGGRHPNQRHSPLAEARALALDAHFLVGQSGSNCRRIPITYWTAWSGTRRRTVREVFAHSQCFGR
jgi:hypothetical protein